MKLVSNSVSFSFEKKLPKTIPAICLVKFNKRTRSDILQGQALFRKVKNCLPEVFRQTDKGLSEIIEGESVPPFVQPFKQKWAISFNLSCLRSKWTKSLTKNTCCF